MPPLTSVNIPFSLTKSPISSDGTSLYDTTGQPLPTSTRGKAADRPPSKRPPGRTYDDSPLPIKLIDDISYTAQIQARIIDLRGVWYQLKFDQDVKEVSVERVLEYVSPQQLEEFEMKQFEEERALIAIAEAEEQRVAKERAVAKKERAKRKGIVVFEEVSDSSDVESEPHAGRSRPTYAHMFQLPQKVRRRRKRDPATGELMPLSDHGSEDDMAVEIPQPTVSSASRRARAASKSTMNIIDAPPKRRRRKRDAQTGELLPLSPELEAYPNITEPSILERQWTERPLAEPDFIMLPEKRPRRRRHPQTGELMPLGWKWIADASEPTSISKPDSGGISPSMDRLSLSQEHGPKRQKIASSESSSDDIDIESFTSLARPGDLQNQKTTVYLSTSDESTDQEFDTTTMRKQRATSKNALDLPAPSSSAISPVNGLSQDANVPDATLPDSMTSMLHPTPRDRTVPSSEENSELNELDEGEFLIEAILAHNLSDPRTHDPEHGNEPIMLYKVRWYGDVFPKTTWEPIESFPDPSIVHDYQRRAGLTVTNI